MTANPYAQARRTEKACALADMLDAFGVDPDWAENAPALVRLDTAEAAGVRLPSDETWQMAVAMLRGRLAVRASLAGTDPFEGLPS